MIYREKYLSEIRGFYDDDLIKIITGVRRSGKSVVLEQIREELSAKTNNIVSLDFDDRLATDDIETWQDIVRYVTGQRGDGLCYVFLDEVQEIEGWANACRALRRENCSVFITGSNSKLLSKEFTKQLSGRYVSFRIRPFVYLEILEYAKQLHKSCSIPDYLIWGGFPKRFEYATGQEQARYLRDLNEAIVSNDLINRYHIRKQGEFRKVVNYILISNSRIYSAKSISDHMLGNGISLSSNTVQKWIGYLEKAYIIDEVSRYSRKAKKELEQSHKVYNCDVALNSIRCGEQRYDLTHNLENIVYNELIYRDFSVTVYDNNGREIDFLAEKDKKRYYIQVAYSVVEDKAWHREFGAFSGIPATDRKILITNDDIDYSTSAVEHIRLSDFLTQLKPF